MRAFLSIDQVAEYLGVGHMAIRRLLYSGELPHVKVGKVYRIRREVLEQWLNDGGKRPEAEE